MNTPIVSLVIRNYKLLIAIFLISGLVAYFLTHFLITPLYRAETVIYVPNTHANIHLVQAGMRFGYDKEVGEHIEVLNSNAVRDAMIREFDLAAHYDIDAQHAKELEKLYELYHSHVSIDRSINKSIHINVLNRDTEMAANMANALVKLADDHKSTVVKSNIEVAAVAAKADYEKWENLIALMRDSLETLRQEGESVWNLGEERKSSKFENYEIQYRKEIDEYYALRKRYNEFATLLNQEIPKSYVVSTAQASGKAAYPKKGLISILAAVSSVVITLSILSLKKPIDS